MEGYIRMAKYEVINNENGITEFYDEGKNFIKFEQVEPNKYLIKENSLGFIPDIKTVDSTVETFKVKKNGNEFIVHFNNH